MEFNASHYYDALKARDARFDGQFFVGVSSTGIYCRPVCTVRTPKRENCSFFSTAAAAEAQGYRPCLRCRPEIAPGQSLAVAPVDALRAEAWWTAARIHEGALNNGDLDALARRYGRSSRQLRRAVVREYGVAPVELAQTRRLLLAKQLLTDSHLPIAEVAQASGFASLRRFNHLFKTRYGLNPTRFRLQGRNGVEQGREAVVLKLAYRPPLDWSALIGFLAARGASGVESLDGARYLRTVLLGGCSGWFAAAPWPEQNALRLEVSPSLMPVLTPLLARVRRLFDLDASPDVIAGHLGRDKRLRMLLRRTSGLRVPGAFDGFELALRAVLGQQVTVKAASTMFSRLTAAFGEPAATPHQGLRYFSPTAEALAGTREVRLRGLGLTGARARTLQALARAVTRDGLQLDGSLPIEHVKTQLLSLPGIGEWTVQYIAMRALGDPDAFPNTDLGLMKTLGTRQPRALLAAAERWRPWRAYAAIHLWNSLQQGG